MVLTVLVSGCGKKKQESQQSETQNVSLANRIFEEAKPFDSEAYGGAMQVISTMGDDAANISLYVKQGDEYAAFGELEIKGKIILGAEGILGYMDTFRRIRLLADNGNWKDIERKAIKNGRLFIETKEDKELYTIHGIHATQYTGILELGIQLPDAGTEEAK